MNYTVRNLLIAIVLMIVGIVLTTSWIRQERQEISRGNEEVKVLVATRDIPAGTPAKELEEGGFVEMQSVIREDTPPMPIGKVSTLEGLVSNETVYKGEMLTMRAFDKEAGLKPTASVKGNERIVSVAVFPFGDAAGAIRPGDHIDIMSCAKVDKLVCDYAARDILVRETPESLVPDTGDEAAPATPDPDGDRRLYQLQLTDREAMQVLFAQSAADGRGLQFLLRPSHGDTETPSKPVTSPDAATTG